MALTRGLTERRIRDAKPADKTTILWDDQVVGLGLRVTPKGARAFILNYRTGGRERRMTLAKAAEISLREVRKLAGRHLATIRNDGADPLAKRQEQREAPTVNDALKRFFDEFAPARIEAGRLTENTVADYRKQARRYVGPVLGTLRVAKVTRHDVEKFAAKLTKTPSQRNRTLAFLSRIFTLTEHWEWREQRTNPVRGVERAREQARDRVLAPSELHALSRSLDDVEQHYPFPVAAIKTAALTGLRISECLSMKWEHVSLETGRVTLPHTKTGRRVVPLAAPVLELFAGLPRINGNSYVFAGRGRAAVGYKLARRVFSDAAEMAELRDVRLHDLRRTTATNLAAAGVNAYTLRDVLGHATLTMSNRYVRAAGDALTEATERAASMTVAAMSGKR